MEEVTQQQQSNVTDGLTNPPADEAAPNETGQEWGHTDAPAGEAEQGGQEKDPVAVDTIPILKRIGYPKYGIDGEGRICNAATGEPIPDDEPIMILRAKDRLAYATLDTYYRMALARCGGEHCESIAVRMQEFRRFSEDHPDRMKTPDTAAPEPANTEGLAVEAES